MLNACVYDRTDDLAQIMHTCTVGQLLDMRAGCTLCDGNVYVLPGAIDGAVAITVCIRVATGASSDNTGVTAASCAAAAAAPLPAGETCADALTGCSTSLGFSRKMSVRGARSLHHCSAPAMHGTS